MKDSLLRLFQGNPFRPLQDHMAKVEVCCQVLPELLQAMQGRDLGQIREVARTISRLEGEADEIKNHVRDHLPSTLFLPVARGDLLEVLHVMDAIADAAEDVAVLATFRPLVWSDDLTRLYGELVEKVLVTVDQAGKVVASLDELVEASFGGAEAARFLEGINELGILEHEADKVQDQLARHLFTEGESYSAPDFFLWLRVVQKTGDVANAAERMGNRIRTFVTK